MAETIIDRLIVKLGLDATDYDKRRKQVSSDQSKFKKEQKEIAKEIEAAQKKQDEAFDKTTKKINTTFLALAAGAYVLKRFIQDTAQTNGELYRLARNIDVSANSMDAFGKAAIGAGGSAEGLQNTLAGISRARTEYELTGQSGLTNLMSYLGLFDKFIDKSVTETELLKEMNKQFTQMPREQAYNVGQMFGIDPGTMNFLLQSQEDFAKSIEKANALSDEQLSNLNALDLAWKKASSAMSSYWQKLVADGGPAMTKMANWVASNPLFASLIGGGAAIGGYFGSSALIKSIRERYRPPALPGSEAAKDAAKSVGSKGRFAAGPWAAAVMAMLYSKNANEGERDYIAESLGAKRSGGRLPILDTIAKAESSGSYDIANKRQGGKYVATQAGLSGKTLSEVMEMQKNKSVFAVGRYQIIPETLARAVKRMGLSGSEMFDSSMQDKLAMQILPKAAKDYLSGKSDNSQAALLAIAKVWRGVADPRTGKTYGDSAAGFNHSSVLPTEALESLNASRQINNTTTIGQLVINTAATDATGIAKDIHRALNGTQSAQANSGMQ